MLTQFKISSFSLSFLSKNLKGKIGSITPKFKRDNLTLSKYLTLHSMKIWFLMKYIFLQWGQINVNTILCTKSWEGREKRGWQTIPITSKFYGLQTRSKFWAHQTLGLWQNQTYFSTDNIQKGRVGGSRCALGNQWLKIVKSYFPY